MRSDHPARFGVARAPTLSLLRLSAAHRLIGATGLIVVLWAMVAMVIV